jgi:tetratricopeptide (TPR) repeat protein
VLADMKELVKLDFKPGSKYAYNNSNTFFQRRIVEKLTGMPFNRFVTDSMLKRLDMRSSVVDPTDKDPLVAKSFNKDGVADPLEYPISGWTAVTIDDFYKWSQALNSFRLIKPASTFAIIIPYARDKQAGLGKGEMRGNKIITHVHDGSARNYQAFLDVDNSKGRTIIWMTNSKNQQMFAVTEAIHKILDGQPFTIPKRSVVELMQKKLDSLKGKDIIRYYEELKTKYADEYAFESESELNTIGYSLMGKGRMDDAIVVFEYNTKLFPKSGNAFDSLGEAYYNKGDWKNSLLNYNTSLRLDPNNKGAREKIIELRTK